MKNNDGLCKLIEQNRQAELLPYLESESVSIQRDVAGLLFRATPHNVPENCNTI